MSDNVIRMRQCMAPGYFDAGDLLCKTVGELIQANFVYLLDRGEHDLLRRLMVEASDWLRELPFPEHEDEATTRDHLVTKRSDGEQP